MKEVGIVPQLRVPEPNTWREVLSTIDREGVELGGKQVAVQEYGKSNPSLIAGLEARDALCVGAHGILPLRMFSLYGPGTPGLDGASERDPRDLFA
jgi:hypothetical protein